MLLLAFKKDISIIVLFDPSITGNFVGSCLKELNGDMQRKIFYLNPKILYSKKAKAESQIRSRKDEKKIVGEEGLL